MVRLLLGDCIEKMKELEDNSIDSIVCDPPYEIGFMDKKWDNSGVAYNVEVWKECLRVLKPGGHLLAFGGTRTYHRMTVAIEDAGFQIRDCLMWVYGSGFPKSHNIGNGWGTALKPSVEPIVMARKSFKGTVSNNVSKYGTGAINIDECRVGDEEISTHNAPKGTFAGGEENRGSDTNSYKTHIGRWPANLLHDGSEEVLELFPDSKSTGKNYIKDEYEEKETSTPFKRGNLFVRGDDGSAARFFYCAKTSKKDRDEGCEDLEEKEGEVHIVQSEGRKNAGTNKTFPRHNHHPTVKPTELMKYLCRLITPKEGIVLDPFMGSGSTGKAALLEGFSFIGIELNNEYYEIAKRRVKE